MPDASVRRTTSHPRSYAIVGHVYLDDPVLCAMVETEAGIRVALNLYHGGLALAHAESHIAAGIDDALICSLDCPGP